MQPAYGEDQDLFGEGEEANEQQQYNDYGASEDMDLDNVPVTQEDAWAVIS